MHLAARRLVGRIVAANLVPDAVASPELEAKLAKDGEPEAPDYRAMSRAPDEGVRREWQPWEVGWLEERDGPQGQVPPYGIPSHLQSGKERDWLYQCHRTRH